MQECTFLYKRMLIQHVKEKINERSKQLKCFISNMIMNGLHVNCFCFWHADKAVYICCFLNLLSCALLRPVVNGGFDRADSNYIQVEGVPRAD